MMVPEEEGVCAIEDMLRGTIELDWSMVDAQILLKSDGLPTYHLANVVDDHLMEITHVIRGGGESTRRKHQLLYEYFGWEYRCCVICRCCGTPTSRSQAKPYQILYYQHGYLPQRRTIWAVWAGRCPTRKKSYAGRDAGRV